MLNTYECVVYNLGGPSAVYTTRAYSAQNALTKARALWDFVVSVKRA